MPTRKIETSECGRKVPKTLPFPPPNYCQGEEHDPLGHVVLSPGLYEHQCPDCKKKTLFRVEEGPRI